MNNELPFSKKVLIALSLSILLISLVYLFINGINVFLLIFAGILLAIFVRGLSGLLVRYVSIPKKFSPAMVILLIAGILYGGGLLLGPSISEGFSELSRKIPETFQELQSTISQYSWGKEISKNAEKAYHDVLNNPKLAQKITGVFSTTLGAILNIFVILVIGLYLSFDPLLYKKGLLKLFTKNIRIRVEEILDAVRRALSWWMVGQFSSMAVVGILTIIGLLILGIPLAFTLGILAAALTFIPNIGPFISAIPAVLIGLVQSPAKALYVILLYVGIQTFESYLITPQIQKKAVSLPPALLIAVQILIGVWLGLFGLLLATPLLVVFMVIVQMAYVKDCIGEEVDTLGEQKAD